MRAGHLSDASTHNLLLSDVVRHCLSMTLNIDSGVFSLNRDMYGELIINSNRKHFQNITPCLDFPSGAVIKEHRSQIVQTMKRSEGFMKKILVPSWISALLLFAPILSEIHLPQAAASEIVMTTSRDDLVIGVAKSLIPFRLAVVSAPAAPTVLLRKVVCNYIVPANDYVAFPLPYTGIFIPASGASKETNYNSIMITFEVAPTAPIFVWLQQTASGGTATTPIYVNQSSPSVVIPYYSGNTWFEQTTSTTMGFLCIQGIYPTPPPDSFYYPVSCTIVYQ